MTRSACGAAITAHNAYGKPVASLTFASAASAVSPSLSTLKAVPNSGSCVAGETKGRTPLVDPLQLTHLATFGIGQMVDLNARRSSVLTTGKLASTWRQHLIWHARTRKSLRQAVQPDWPIGKISGRAPLTSCGPRTGKHRKKRL